MICSSMCLTSNSSGSGERSFSDMTSGWFTGSPSSARWMITILCRGTCSVQSSKKSMLSIANQMLFPFLKKSGEEQLALHAFQGQGSSGSRSQCILLNGY